MRQIILYFFLLLSVKDTTINFSERKMSENIENCECAMREVEENPESIGMDMEVSNDELANGLERTSKL